jgi:tight adherence protein B
VSRRHWLALAPATALVAALLTAAPVSAGTNGFGLTEAGGASFPDRAFVLTLPAEQRLSPEQVRVFENGRQVSDVSVVPVGAAGADEFGVVLVIDASMSMQGKPEDAALSAARAFAAQRTARQQLAVLTYNLRPSVQLPFTTDEGEIDDALSKQPKFVFGTHIYDAVVKALDVMKSSHINVGSVVVLSDGQEHPGFNDVRKHETEESAAAAARAAHARVFTVGLQSRLSRLSALQKLAHDTNASYVEAKSLDALNAIYNQLGSQLAHEYLLRYRSPAQQGTKVWVTVKVQGVSGQLRNGYATLALAAPPPSTGYHRGFGNSFWMSPFTMIVFGTFAVGLLAFCIFALLQPRRRSVQRRLAEFVSLAQSADGQSVGTPASDRVAAPVESTASGSTWWQRFLEELEIGEIEMKASHIVLWTLAGTIAFMWLIAVLFTFAAVVLGLLIPFAVWSFVKRKAERKRTQFAEQLPDNLAVLASAIRAGHSFVGALSVVVNDAPEPARSEFQRVVADEQLGRPLDEALETVVYRMRNQDLAQVALVAALQRETGGSTAEVLDRVVDTVRDRQELRRLVKTLTAAGRMSRWVVSFLPLVLILAIWILSPSYLHPLFSHTSGRILFVFATLLVVCGSLVIKRIVDIKV